MKLEDRNELILPSLPWKPKVKLVLLLYRLKRVLVVTFLDNAYIFKTMNNRTQFMKRFHLFSRRSNMHKIVQIGITYMYFSWLLIYFFLSRKNVRIFDDNPFYLVCLKYNVQNTDDMQLVLNFLSGIDACDLWISFSRQYD